MLGDVLPVQSEDVPFDVVDFAEIMGLTYFDTAWGMPPTSMYSRNSRMAFLCSESGSGLRFLNESAMSVDSGFSPKAQRNSSKSMGFRRIDSSSDGMRMSLTFSRMETSEPVSM